MISHFSLDMSKLSLSLDCILLLSHFSPYMNKAAFLAVFCFARAFDSGKIKIKTGLCDERLKNLINYSNVSLMSSPASLFSHQH